ncbi:MAG: discoidin domain-containing protein [Pseudomonadota bacterium]
MTDGKSDNEQAVRVSGAHRGKRVVEWFWRGAALAESKRAFPEPSSRTMALARRARHSAAIARTVLAPAEPMQDASLRAAASELYRESVYWALCALSVESDSVAGTVYDEAVWERLDESLLARAVQGSEKALALRPLLRAGSFVAFAELPEASRVLVCSELQALARLLCGELDARERAVRANYLERGLRLGLLALLALVFVAGALHFRDGRELATGMPWKASSMNGGLGCASPAQHCSQSPNFFFHTTEEVNPWLEFDLGATQRISRMRIENRLDCCSDRAVPLDVEVSTDHENWKMVARQAEEFTTWNVSFDSSEARWVRLRTYRKTYLHLAEVRIWP